MLARVSAKQVSSSSRSSGAPSVEATGDQALSSPVRQISRPSTIAQSRVQVWGANARTSRPSSPPSAPPAPGVMLTNPVEVPARIHAIAP